ncbi:hypothetical protein D9M70_527560 [compost metagenome]
MRPLSTTVGILGFGVICSQTFFGFYDSPIVNRFSGDVYIVNHDIWNDKGTKTKAELEVEITRERPLKAINILKYKYSGDADFLVKYGLKREGVCHMVDYGRPTRSYAPDIYSTNRAIGIKFKDCPDVFFAVSDEVGIRLLTGKGFGVMAKLETDGNRSFLVNTIHRFRLDNWQGKLQ